MYSSQGLMEIQLIVCPQNQTFNGVDLCLSISRNLKVDFLKPDYWMLRFHNFSIEIRLVHGSKQYLNSEIAKPACKLHLIIPKSAFRTFEANDHYFPKEGYLREQYIRLTSLHAIRTLTLSSHCWIDVFVPSSVLLRSAKRGSISFFFIIVDIIIKSYIKLIFLGRMKAMKNIFQFFWIGAGILNAFGLFRLRVGIIWISRCCSCLVMEFQGLLSEDY